MNPTVLLGVLMLVGADPEPAKPTAHTKREVAGWTVQVDDRLLSGPDADLGTRALKLMEGQLEIVALVVPEDRLKKLRAVPIWLDCTHGKLVPAQYHPSAGWLKSHGYSAELARCVHVPDAKYFASAHHQRQQPCAMLHELAHAYHDQVLGFDHAEVKAAWERFVSSGKYKSVLHMDGVKRSHYGLTNEKEFFAEMTESYVGRNDFFPFNAAELKQEEPELYKLMEKIWGRMP
ncbi:zinc-dependent peptidase [Limnoglobus roseus]|uniref:Metallopeptidase n=1 Tax=Limnoglobus roseus TaxID=2598579 RepID=A0A5C1A9R3_9BACT|nr:zinc-dependent peptidase [Limnoglobus roseus]QEL15941.1 hypothetical protein PX52LOC_02877 [Limnoglobus roseus]